MSFGAVAPARYRLYRQFEKSNDNKLDKDEATEFAEFLHKQIADKHSDWKHFGADAPILVKNKCGNYVRRGLFLANVESRTENRAFRHFFAPFESWSKTTL